MLKNNKNNRNNNNNNNTIWYSVFMNTEYNVAYITIVLPATHPWMSDDIPFNTISFATLHSTATQM